MTNDGNIQQELKNMEKFMEGTDEEMAKVSMQAEEMCAVAKYLHIVTDAEYIMANIVIVKSMTCHTRDHRWFQNALHLQSLPYLVGP